MNIPRGFSGYFCIGKTYGGFKIERANFLFRVCLGWIAFGFITYDLEQLIGHGAKHIKTYDATKEFVRDCAKNWDHDPDAHRYGTTCRVCEAEKLLNV